MGIPITSLLRIIKVAQEDGNVRKIKRSFCVGMFQKTVYISWIQDAGFKMQDTDES